MPEQSVHDELSLQEIEGDDWGAPETAETGLIRNVLRYRRMPLRELGTEELRELILQQVSLDVLVPRALTLLEHDPRAAGDLYDGDLLAAVLLAKRGFWRRHPELGTEELRELILQQVSLDLLVPRALTLLELDPRAAGDLYEGDLLAAVLLAKRGFWRRHPELGERAEGIIATLDDDPDEVDLSDDIATFRAAAGRPDPA